MAGNAMEWVADWYSTTYYKDLERDDPTGPATGTRKVEKGGWWGADPYEARSAYRNFEDPPTYQDHHIGFRIVSPVTE
jgi:formylglycine-generating enzyme required for sulfatase activity